MSQRNPLNERYTTEEKQGGKTRKSAASAKPASKAAASVRVEGSSQPQKGLWQSASAKATKQQNSKSQAKAASQAERRERMRYYNPPTAEYKKWRRIWWVVLVVAMVITVGSFFLMSVNQTLSYVLLGIGYAALIGAIVLDVVKIRKIRNAYQDQMLHQKSKEATRTRKQQKAAERDEERRLAELAAAEEARKAAEKSERRSKLPVLTGFGRKTPKQAYEVAREASDAIAASAKKGGSDAGPADDAAVAGDAK